MILLGFYKNVVKSFFQYILVQINDKIKSKTLSLHLTTNKFDKILSENNVKNEENREEIEVKNIALEDKDISKEINIFETNNFYNMFFEEFKKINKCFKEVEFNSLYSLLSFIKQLII